MIFSKIVLKYSLYCLYERVLKSGTYKDCRDIIRSYGGSYSPFCDAGWWVYTVGIPVEPGPRTFVLHKDGREFQL